MERIVPIILFALVSGAMTCDHRKVQKHTPTCDVPQQEAGLITDDVSHCGTEIWSVDVRTPEKVTVENNGFECDLVLFNRTANTIIFDNAGLRRFLRLRAFLFDFDNRTYYRFEASSQLNNYGRIHPPTGDCRPIDSESQFVLRAGEGVALRCSWPGNAISIHKDVFNKTLGEPISELPNGSYAFGLRGSCLAHMVKRETSTPIVVRVSINDPTVGGLLGRS